VKKNSIIKIWRGSGGRDRGKGRVGWEVHFYDNLKK